jgi:hypothetical protein
MAAMLWLVCQHNVVVVDPQVDLYHRLTYFGPLCMGNRLAVLQACLFLHCCCCCCQCCCCRDCATGELRTVTDPSQRCEAQTVCPDVTNTTTIAAPGNAAGSPAAFAVSQILATLLGVAMLALML